MEPRLPEVATTADVTAPSLTTSSLTIRTISGVVLGAYAIASVLGGSPWYQIMVAIGGALMAWEWGRMCGHGRHGLGGFAMTLGAIAMSVAAAFGQFGAAVVIGAILLPLTWAVARWQSEPAPAWQAAGLVLVGLPVVAMHFVFLADPLLGLFSAAWVLSVTIASDIGAYFAGRAIGGPKLAPRISPKKTWAGLIGGILLAVTVSVALVLIIEPQYLWVALIGSAVLGIAAPLGDLGESFVKRRFRIKDSAGIIPGHGGALDRFDGLAATMMVAGAVALANGGSLWVWQ